MSKQLTVQKLERNLYDDVYIPLILFETTFSGDMLKSHEIIA